MLIFLSQTVDCSDVIQNSNKSWLIVMDMCGFNKVSGDLRSFVSKRATQGVATGPGHLSMDVSNEWDKDSLSFRTLLQIHHALKDKARQFPTSLVQDEDLLQALERNFSSLVAAGHPVLVHSPGGALLRQMNAIRYRFFLKKHLEGLCQLYGAEECFHTSQASAEKSRGKASMHEEEEGNNAKINLFDEWGRKDRDDDVALQRRLRLFNDWFDSFIVPPAVNHLKADLIPGFRVGTIATKDLSQDELYLAVPFEVIIDSHKADRDPQFGKLLFDLERRFYRRDDFHELLLYLVYQCFVLGSESKFWPYLRLLPTPAELDRPLMWTKEEVSARLGPSFIKESIFRYLFLYLFVCVRALVSVRHSYVR